MIDLLLAVLLHVLPLDPIRPAPYTAPQGEIRTIPDPLPYVLEETHWGPA